MKMCLLFRHGIQCEIGANITQSVEYDARMVLYR